MIPKASQRGSGQDLAAHLLNVSDNELVDIAELRGTAVDDLHGAFAEWEAQAHALTQCQKYLYSMAISPDQKQGQLTREQYYDYIERAEDSLGLTGQPRAVVFHIKYGREHCHVVWSRIDAFNEKAVHLAFDKDKLMRVTRGFARDHGLSLPDGYKRHEQGGRDMKIGQQSIYDMAKQRQSGLSRQDHIDTVTDAWRASDSPKAFVSALADKGYLLATGKRPYVLVDYYGGMHALPKLIDDKSVRTKDLVSYLGAEYAPETLPHVDEAKRLIAGHRKQVEAGLKLDEKRDALEALERSQQKRRAAAQQEHETLRQALKTQAGKLAEMQANDRAVLRQRYLDEARAIRRDRYEKRPRGLADFLGKVSGVNLVRAKLHKHQDRQRLRRYQEQRTALKAQHQRETDILTREHEVRMMDANRNLRALDQIERKERQSVEETLLREARVHQRGGRQMAPSVALALTPRGRRAARHKAAQRHTSSMARDLHQEKMRGRGRLDTQYVRAVAGKTAAKPVDLEGDFNSAAGESEGRAGGSEGDGAKLASDRRIRRYRGRRPRSRGKDRDRER